MAPGCYAEDASRPRAGVDLVAVADRYRELLEIGEELRVTPAAEIWGSRAGFHRIGHAILVALEAHHPKACVLPDVYHLYKGGSGSEWVRRIRPSLLGGFHLNDYSAEPTREAIRDRDRVYPGDGIAPLGRLLGDLWAGGYRGPVSLELFNPAYWREDAEVVVRRALEKARAVVRAALSR